MYTLFCCKPVGRLSRFKASDFQFCRFKCLRLSFFMNQGYLLVLFGQGYPVFKVGRPQFGPPSVWSPISLNLHQFGLPISLILHQFGHPINLVLHQFGPPSVWSSISLILHQFGSPSIWFSISFVLHQFGPPSVWSSHQFGPPSIWSSIS